MNIIETQQVGPLRIRLIEKLSALDPEVFAPRYYLDIHHDNSPHFGIVFLDQNITRAKTKFYDKVRVEGRIRRWEEACEAGN